MDKSSFPPPPPTPRGPKCNLTSRKINQSSSNGQFLSAGGKTKRNIINTNFKKQTGISKLLIIYNTNNYNGSAMQNKNVHQNTDKVDLITFLTERAIWDDSKQNGLTT
jgi:hypothetical protein